MCVLIASDQAEPLTLFYILSPSFVENVELIPVLLLVVGIVAAFKPQWIAAIDRRQKAAGMTRRPRDIEMSDTYYSVVRAEGNQSARAATNSPSFAATGVVYSPASPSPTVAALARLYGSRHQRTSPEWHMATVS